MNKRFYRKNSRSGFTLVETVTSLMIFSIIILVIGMIFYDIKSSCTRNLTGQFYSYLNLIDEQHYKIKRCDTNELTLSKNEKIYFIKFSPDHHQLTMSTDKGGYVPLMNQIKNVNWRRDHNVVDQQFTMMGGEEFSGKSKFLN